MDNPEAFDLAVEHYVVLLDEEVERGSAGALLELEGLLAWMDYCAALLREAMEAAWEVEYLGS